MKEQNILLSNSPRPKPEMLLKVNSQWHSVETRPQTTFLSFFPFQQGLPPPTRVYKLVLTGGPCGGKTTAQSKLATFFENLGWKVFRVPETASVLMSGGIAFGELNQEQVEDFQVRAGTIHSDLGGIDGPRFLIAEEPCPGHDLTGRHLLLHGREERHELAGDLRPRHHGRLFLHL